MEISKKGEYMGLTKEELKELLDKVKISEKKIRQHEFMIKKEKKALDDIRKKLQETCDHVIVVYGKRYQDDDPVYYHMCVKCGLLTGPSDYRFTSSLYGYNTKLCLENEKGEEQYKEYLKENPNITDEELVKRFVKDYKGEDAANKLVLKKERTDHGKK